MMPEPKMNCTLDAALWRSSTGDVVVHAKERGAATDGIWASRNPRDGLLNHGDCKHLIFRRLSPSFTFFHHISHHFSAISIWFLAGCREMAGYLNCSVIAGAKMPLKPMMFQMMICKTDGIYEPTQAAKFTTSRKVTRLGKDARLLPDFRAISAYFRLFRAKIHGGGGIPVWYCFAGCNRSGLGLDSSQQD